MGTIKLALKVIPGAAKTEIVGWLGNALKIRISALPQKGKANKRVIALIANTLEIDSRSIKMTHGQSSPHKLILISNIDQSVIDTKLGRPLPS